MNRGTLPILARLQSLQATSRIVPGGGRVIAEVTAYLDLHVWALTRDIRILEDDFFAVIFDFFNAYDILCPDYDE